MTFHECCRAIVANSEAKALNYAVGYAQAGLTMPEGSHEAKVQALYVLNNITHWRGDLAKKVRTALRGLTP